MSDQRVRPIVQVVAVGGIAVATYIPSTGAYTPAVRCAPAGRPVSAFPRPLTPDLHGDD